MITDIGAASLANALEINSTMTALDISFNYFGDAGRLSLREAMIWNQTITYLCHESYRGDSILTFVADSQNEWIVRKNQSLFALLFQSLEQLKAI